MSLISAVDLPNHYAGPSFPAGSCNVFRCSMAHAYLVFFIIPVLLFIKRVDAASLLTASTVKYYLLLHYFEVSRDLSRVFQIHAADLFHFSSAMYFMIVTSVHSCMCCSGDVTLYFLFLARVVYIPCISKILQQISFETFAKLCLDF